MIRNNCLSSYESFALVYDILMKDVPYENWVKYIYKIWKRYNFEPKLIGELGCGTGNISLLLAKDGFDIIGIDNSIDMLMQAKQKAGDNNLDILFLNQSMTDFELYGTLDCFLCLFDSINYLLRLNDLTKTFKLVNNYLNPSGLFIFDINTQYKYKNQLANNTFAETTEETAYIWENHYNEFNCVNEYYLDFFVKDENTEKYSRYEETHYQKAYNCDEIITAIKESGLILIDMFDAFTFDKVKTDSERIYFITQEKGKER